MTSSGFQEMPGWYWPDDIPKTEPQESTSNPSKERDIPRSTDTNEPPELNQRSKPEPRYWRPRQCRICLEVVNPTYHTPSEHLPGIFQSSTPNVTYESEEGRLIRPCKCKGSSKYVHEGCLQAWRHADPGYGRRNYWQCPTCGFKYHLARLGWGRLVASATAQIVLTVVLLFAFVFLLGFVADPIINMYLDPWSYFWPFGSSRDYYYDYDDDDETSSWTEHFLKGFTSMGVLGFLKVLFSSPLSYFRIGGRGRATTGRDRYEQVSWFIIMIGVLTFLVAIFKGVRAWSRRTLEKAGERVMDVHDDEEDDEDEPAT